MIFDVTANEKKKRASGAGVKADDGVLDTERSQVRLDPESKTLAAKIGKGNVSLGLREALRRVEEAGDTRPFSVARHAKRRQK
jgi:hypothetical protein